jgi:tetratricopeptide (TPR) repeat protein
MFMMRKLLPVLLVLLSFLCNAQQNPGLEDSLKRKLSKAVKPADRVYVLSELCQIFMSTNMQEADKYGKLLLQEAEISRDRKLMVQALLANGDRFSYFGSIKDYNQKSIDYYNKALEVARQNDLDEERAKSLLKLSSLYRQVPDLDKAFNYVTQASSIISNSTNDSLRIVALNTLGNIYQDKKDRLLALRNYLNALTLAEEMKLKDPDILRSCYYTLCNFYAGIKEYDKAIDYAKKAMDQLELVKKESEKYNGVKYSRVADLYSLGNLYLGKKNFDMSQYYYEASIKLADSVKYEPMKMYGYRGLLNQYIREKQPQKALNYFNTNPLIKKYISNAGLGYVIDGAYGTLYSEVGKFDSAKYYFEKAKPQYERATTPASKIYFYTSYADFLNKSGASKAAIDYYLQAKLLAEQTSDLEWQQKIAKELDTVYAKTGEYKQSYFYNSLYNRLKDSLQKLGEEKDLMQMELKDEELRKARRDKEREEVLRKKHDLQYMAIAISIGVIFTLLVLMGAFKVSEATIKIVGFFAFILLFEFIILLADNRIHEWTHGEPLPVLGIKIVLIAMLLPLHHWMEHKVVSYLASKRLIIPDRKSIWNNLVKRKPVEH